MKILLDTNIVLRNAIRTDPQHPQVHQALARLVRDGWELCIGTQNVIEFWVVATRPTNVNGLGLSPRQAEVEVKALLGAFTLLADPDDLIDRWLDLCARYGVSGRPAHDARLVAVMLSHGIKHLLTLNVADFTRYAERISDPGTRNARIGG